MTFTAGNTDMATISRVGHKVAADMVDRALDAGVNLFDTADAYAGGESEALLGQALKPHRERVIVATKVGFRTGSPITQARLSRRHILWSVDQSLRRLGTDWIDLYIAHLEDGKVRYLGFSNWSAWKVAAALEIQSARGLAQFTHGQMYYSLLGRDVERDVIPMMQHYGIGLTVWSPLASGFLSGKYTRETLKSSDNRFRAQLHGDVLDYVEQFRNSQRDLRWSASSRSNFHRPASFRAPKSGVPRGAYRKDATCTSFDGPSCGSCRGKPVFRQQRRSGC